MKKATYECSPAFLATMACLALATWTGCVSPGIRLLRSAEKGDTENVRKLLAEGADIDSKSDYGWTALVEAADNGHINTVAALLKEEADVNARTNYGATALSRAAMRGHTETVKMLLEYKADANAAEEDGTTALMYAARGGNGEMVQDLLRRGADVNAKDLDGWTPLMYAVAGKANANVVNLLIEQGANVSTRSIDFQSAYLRHSTSGGPNPFDRSHRYDRTPLSIAREQQKTGIIQLLKKTKASGEDNEAIVIDTDFFENLPKKTWSAVRTLDRIEVRHITVPSVIRFASMRVESVPGGVTERQNVKSQIWTLCKRAGYQLTAQSKLYIEVEYSEFLALSNELGTGMAAGTGMINTTGSGQTEKRVFVNVAIHHEGYGLIRRIKVNSVREPFTQLGKLWPFSRGIKSFIALLEDGSPPMQISASRTLGTVYADVGQSAIPTLERLSEVGRHWHVRHAAKIAMQRIRRASSNVRK